MTMRPAAFWTPTQIQTRREPPAPLGPTRGVEVRAHLPRSALGDGVTWCAECIQPLAARRADVELYVRCPQEVILAAVMASGT